MKNLPSVFFLILYFLSPSNTFADDVNSSQVDHTETEIDAAAFACSALNPFRTYQLETSYDGPPIADQNSELKIDMKQCSGVTLCKEKFKFKIELKDTESDVVLKEWNATYDDDDSDFKIERSGLVSYYANPSLKLSKEIFEHLTGALTEEGVKVKLVITSTQENTGLACKNFTKTESYNQNVRLVFLTKPLRDPPFKGENTSCVWQPKSDCPPYVKYLTPEQAEIFQFEVGKDGLIYNALGGLLDTTNADSLHSVGKAIFVMAPWGQLYGSKEHYIYRFHHSSLLAGAPVAAAGEMEVIKGVLTEINNCSGHYWPSVKLVKQVFDSLTLQGYSRTSDPIFIHKKVNDCATFLEKLDLQMFEKK